MHPSKVPARVHYQLLQVANAAALFGLRVLTWSTWRRNSSSTSNPLGISDCAVWPRSSPRLRFLHKVPHDLKASASHRLCCVSVCQTRSAGRHSSALGCVEQKPRSAARGSSTPPHGERTPRGPRKSPQDGAAPRNRRGCPSAAAVASPLQGGGGDVGGGDRA